MKSTRLDIGIEGPSGAGKSTLLEGLKRNTSVKVTVYFEDYKTWHATPPDEMAQVITNHFKKTYDEIIEEGSTILLRDRTGYSQHFFHDEQVETVYPKLDYLFCLIPPDPQWCKANVVKRGRRFELKMIEDDPAVFDKIWRKYHNWNFPGMRVFTDRDELYRHLLQLIDNTCTAKDERNA